MSAPENTLDDVLNDALRTAADKRRAERKKAADIALQILAREKKNFEALWKQGRIDAERDCTNLAAVRTFLLDDQQRANVVAYIKSALPPFASPDGSPFPRATNSFNHFSDIVFQETIGQKLTNLRLGVSAVAFSIGLAGSFTEVGFKSSAVFGLFAAGCIGFTPLHKFITVPFRAASKLLFMHRNRDALQKEFMQAWQEVLLEPQRTVADSVLLNRIFEDASKAPNAEQAVGGIVLTMLECANEAFAVQDAAKLTAGVKPFREAVDRAKATIPARTLRRLVF